ncbi:MAG: hypothetical protein ABWZ64_19400 [Xanthobacteraceae bacterium]
MQATTQPAKTGLLHTAALAVSIAGTLFWLYTFYGIPRCRPVTAPASSGSRSCRLGLSFVFTFPALVCAWNDQFLWAALVIGCAGLIAFALLWNELLGEFYHTS